MSNILEKITIYQSDQKHFILKITHPFREIEGKIITVRDLTPS